MSTKVPDLRWAFSWSSRDRFGVSEPRRGMHILVSSLNVIWQIAGVYYQVSRVLECCIYSMPTHNERFFLSLTSRGLYTRRRKAYEILAEIRWVCLTKNTTNDMLVAIPWGRTTPLRIPASVQFQMMSWGVPVKHLCLVLKIMWNLRKLTRKFRNPLRWSGVHWGYVISSYT